MSGRVESVVAVLWHRYRKQATHEQRQWQTKSKKQSVMSNSNRKLTGNWRERGWKSKNWSKSMLTVSWAIESHPEAEKVDQAWPLHTPLPSHIVSVRRILSGPRTASSVCMRLARLSRGGQPGSMLSDCLYYPLCNRPVSAGCHSAHLARFSAALRPFRPCRGSRSWHLSAMAPSSLRWKVRSCRRRARHA